MMDGLINVSGFCAAVRTTSITAHVAEVGMSALDLRNPVALLYREEY